MNYIATVTGTNQQTGDKLRVVATLKYDPAHRLIALQIEGDVTDVFHRWFFSKAPILTESQMKQFMYTAKNIKLEVVQEDLSFNKFWDTYDNKISNKKRSEKLWVSMKDTDRALALSHISVYNHYLFCNPGVTKKHADTYLNQKPWNN